MDSVVMVEGEMQEISEEEMVEAIKYAHDAIKVQIEAQLRLASQVEKAQTKREYSHETHNEEVREEVMAATYDKVYEVAKSGLPKHERSAGFKAILNEYLENKDEEWLAANTGFAKTYFHDVEYKAMRDMVLNEGKRLDGRDTTTVRPIWSEIDYLPGAHGSAVFTRDKTANFSPSEINPMAIPLTGRTNFTPASISASVPAQTVAIEDEPFDARRARTTRRVNGGSGSTMWYKARCARLP